MPNKNNQNTIQKTQHFFVNKLTLVFSYLYYIGTKQIFTTSAG